MTSFSRIEPIWFERLGSLRNVVRQHVVRAQLLAHLDGVATVLDVGCGQGTQALELARRGLAVTGVDPSAELLDRLRADARTQGCEVDAVTGGIDDLPALLGSRRFDLVCAHGLLMYLPDARTALARLAEMTGPDGLVSFTVRNGDALALRPGLRRQWQDALAAFDATTYVNELGADAQAHRFADIRAWCRALGLDIEAWYGVRVLTDAADPAEQPDPDTLDDCLAAEIEAGSRDPYRRLGSQLHIVARRRQPALLG